MSKYTGTRTDMKVEVQEWSSGSIDTKDYTMYVLRTSAYNPVSRGRNYMLTVNAFSGRMDIFRSTSRVQVFSSARRAGYKL